MRLNVVTFVVLGAVTLASASAFADDDDRGRVEHRGPHISFPRVQVQIGPPGGYVQPQPYAYGPSNVYVQPGYTQPTYVQPQPGYGYGSPAYGGGPQQWRDPNTFIARVNERMNGIRSDLESRVQRGMTRPEALGEFDARQRDIQGDLAAAARDGQITPDERGHIREDVDELRFLDQRFRTGYGAYGGGPGRWYRGW